MRGLPGPYKLFWDYLYHACDHAGIWIVDFQIAQIYLGSDMLVDRVKALELFNKNEVRIVELCNGEKWFIMPFIEFQYGELSESNRAHKSVLNILKKYKLEKTTKPLTRPLQGCKDMDMDKDKDKDKDSVNAKNKEVFEVARLIYPGTKRRLDTEFKNFTKKHKNWREILPLLKPAIESQIAWRVNANGKFRPDWKNFPTWINNHGWEEELGASSKTEQPRILDLESKRQRDAMLSEGKLK